MTESLCCLKFAIYFLIIEINIFYIKTNKKKGILAFVFVIYYVLALLGILYMEKCISYFENEIEKT